MRRWLHSSPPSYENTVVSLGRYFPDVYGTEDIAPLHGRARRSLTEELVEGPDAGFNDGNAVFGNNTAANPPLPLFRLIWSGSSRLPWRCRHDDKRKLVYLVGRITIGTRLPGSNKRKGSHPLCSFASE